MIPALIVIDSHTLEVKFEECTVCHTDLESSEDLVNIRMEGSLIDYDGNGDMEEGIMAEIQGLQAMLFAAMQAYSQRGIRYRGRSMIHMPTPTSSLTTDADGAVS